jgi:hypothetical protein
MRTAKLKPSACFEVEPVTKTYGLSNAANLVETIGTLPQNLNGEIYFRRG